MDLRKEYCELNGHSKFNKYNINDYTNFLEQKITEQNQALQLQQTGVKSSVLIEFKEWDYTCGDGCCTSFGTKLFLNGKELEHPNEEIKDNSYVGDDTQTAIHAILKELGYDVKFG
jgi:hypothetical protein